MSEEVKKTVGRPTLGKERMISDSYGIQPEILELLRRASAEQHRSKAELVREGIEMVLAHYGYMKDNTE